ncbi:hypothetical protein M440DRAFT_1402077 [Trichoderma longibrachiatum ATCC 18648]|uniref:Uncharacterized protein n=1 Tax=Trichoderma longibrachiatum ATCC 18648 TaxID=983965 RepID=A0A2T4C1U8_TRILO|nr:hypothetical protein M440DRAFT_1402077 [Trichoderma longibrachiatum ATCC 18648]
MDLLCLPDCFACFAVCFAAFYPIRIFFLFSVLTKRLRNARGNGPAHFSRSSGIIAGAMMPPTTRHIIEATNTYCLEQADKILQTPAK